MLRFGTMGRRIFRIVFGTVIVSILLFGTFSFATLLRTVRANSRATLETTVYQLRREAEQDYQSLLHLSQQMAPSGPVGTAVNEYLRAADVYERGAAKRSLGKIMSTYAGLNTELVLYFDETAGETVLSNLLPVDDFLVELRPVPIYSNNVLSYHAIHPSYSRISMRPVVSILRQGIYEGEAPFTIYIEQGSKLPKTIAEASRVYDIPFVFMQLDMDGVVRYATDPQAFVPGESIDILPNGFGRYGAYYYAAERTMFGSLCVLMAPVRAYNRPIDSWIRSAALMTLVIAAIVFGGATLLYRFVFQGLGGFKKEIDRTIHGDLSPVEAMTGIDELDALLGQFDTMKRRIQKMMLERTEEERARHKAERESLMYQINPHFLLNTLNSVHWVAAMNGQQTISRYISNLSTILSYNLGRTKEVSTLRTELTVLQLYLEIEQSRHDFSVHLSVEQGEYLNTPTPRLILQPVIENAIGHGIDDDGNLYVTIRTDAPQHRIELCIEDDGCGIDAQTVWQLNDAPGTMGGVGLRYVRTMLDSYYGDAAGMRVESMPGRGTRVLLWIPLGREEGLE